MECPRCGRPIVEGFFSPDHCNHCGWIEVFDEPFLMVDEVEELWEQEAECDHLHAHELTGVLWLCDDCGEEFRVD